MSEQAKETAQKLKAEAERLYNRLRGNSPAFSRKWVEVGLDGAAMKEKNLFKYKGFKDEEECRKELQIGRSTWYAAIRCIQNLKKLPRADLFKLTKENAEWLIKLPEEKRYDKEWIKKAQTLKEDDFAKLVIKQRKASSDDGEETPELRVWVKFRMMQSAADIVEECITNLMKQHNLEDDRGRALELMIAEATSGDHVLVAVTKAVPFLRSAVQHFSSELSADEILTKIKDDIEHVAKVLSKAAGVTFGEAVKKEEKKVKAKAAASSTVQ